MIVAKFGGSSLADAVQFQKVKAIIEENPERKYVVPSAPGKRADGDIKVTDLLYMCHNRAARGEDFTEIFEKIKRRYEEIIEGLGLDFSLQKEFETIYQALCAGREEQYAASRGEYLNGILLAAYLGYEFVDAAEVICFEADGTFEAEKTNVCLQERLKETEKAVIPGFYGADENGDVHTFSRGGSDVTGALVARAVHADIYENWTDVPGFLLADPSVVDNPKKIDIMAFAELRELAYRGALVLHEDAVYPVRREGITIHIRNTNHPQENGTMICKKVPPELMSTITGIAGKRDFVAISLAKNKMNAHIGFCKKLLETFEENNVAFEHMPSGIDTISVIAPREEYLEKKDALMDSIQNALHPDKVFVDEDLAMVTVVGKGMRSVSGIAARFFTALGDAKVNIKMIDMGSNEMNCTIGISNRDFETAIRALYDAMVE